MVVRLVFETSRAGRMGRRFGIDTDELIAFDRPSVHGNVTSPYLKRRNERSKTANR